MNRSIETKTTGTHNPKQKDLICVYKQDGGDSSNIIKNFDTSKINANVLEIMDNKRKVLYILSGKDNKKENKIYGSTFTHLNLNRGAQTSIYLITEHNTNVQYVLKLTGFPNDYTNNQELIDKYRGDLTIPDIQKNLIDIKFYGKISVPVYEGTTCTFDYIIVPKYHTFDDHNLHTPLEKYDFLRKLAIFVRTLQLNNWILPDLKLQNIGFDDSGEIILIDYDIEAIYDSKKNLPGSGYTYRSSSCVKNENYNYYSFAMVVVAFFHEEFYLTIWKCIFNDLNKRVYECNDLKEEIVEFDKELIKLDIDTCENNMYYMVIIKECVNNNMSRNIASFQQIIYIIQQIIEKLTMHKAPIENSNTPSPAASFGGYNMQIKNKYSYQFNKQQYYLLSPQIW